MLNPRLVGWIGLPQNKRVSLMPEALANLSRVSDF